MSTQTLYEKIIRSPGKLNWADFFKGFTEKHTDADVDYAMLAGTSLDNAQTEISMVQKWQCPWLYKRVLFGGILGSLVLIAAVFTFIILFGYCVNACLNLLVLALLPCVIPVTLMIFFWEMNAPRNISLIRLLEYFFTGGVLSLLLSLFLFQFIETDGAWIAPFAEEPGKFLIAAFFINRLKEKQGKIYGLNGLTIGAAVGAGFAAFESAQYCFAAWSKAYLYIIATASENDQQFISILISQLQNGLLYFDMQIFMNVLNTAFIRSLCALSSHVLYCAPYSCIFALALAKKGNFREAVKDKSFLISFGISFLVHMLWNGIDFSLYIMLIPAIIVLWYSTLRGARLSFAQIVEKIQVTGSSEDTSTNQVNLRIKGLSGVHAGISFKLKHNEILLGSDASCQLSYPVNVPNIFPKHCKLLVQNGTLYLADLGSQSGTFLNGTRLKPMKGILLKQGDVFWLGSENEKFEVM